MQEVANYIAALDYGLKRLQELPLFLRLIRDLMPCLGEFETFVHSQSLPPLVAIALCHYQFEAIHPFLDGNGRVGRLLITLLLVEKKLLATPILCLSAFFEATRTQYYTALFNVSREGAWNDWLNYFLTGVAVQAQDSLMRLQRISSLITH